MIWQLQNIRGSRDAIKEKVSSSPIPAEVKAYILARLEAKPNAAGFKLDAYSQEASNPSSMTVTEITQVTLVAINL